MKWFLERPKFTTIAVAVVLLLILLIISSNAMKNETSFGGAVRTFVTAIQKPFAKGADFIYVKGSTAASDEGLMSENEQLKAQVDELQEELFRTRLNDIELEELRNLSSSLNTEILGQTFQLKSANIISFSGNQSVNLFTIDVGKEADVERDTIVVNGDGLIGRVIESNKGTSTILSIVDEANKIGFEVASGDIKYIGVCEGNGDGILIGEILDEDADVAEGAIVTTSGIGGIYPQGLVIGTIVKKERTDENMLLTIEIEPSVYFKGLKKVALLL